ncbi:hypothetical protein CONLIGDRAFT_680989 [Coniochaeta ligniaria NRRL 30616]|uniref:Uncharacterized protein n=1 Tax=Coniochaeta ligniaria NRRL 30616 TaxID=1408157 RepID=A0A1J7JR19_9PEZI|nr:hypothetical protein CONLIGDRAFT_680989 [Coniochaeta ligniaria NRRL 30616]
MPGRTTEQQAADAQPQSYAAVRLVQRPQVLQGSQAQQLSDTGDLQDLEEFDTGVDLKKHLVTIIPTPDPVQVPEIMAAISAIATLFKVEQDGTVTGLNRSFLSSHAGHQPVANTVSFHFDTPEHGARWRSPAFLIRDPGEYQFRITLAPNDLGFGEIWSGQFTVEKLSNGVNH